MTKAELLADLELMQEAARAAGDDASDWFRAGEATSAKVSFKPGDSPVSEADLAANAVLERRLRAHRPAYGWVSEESADSEDRLGCARVIIVDPIDGTRAFIAGKPDWCVSVGLVVDGQPAAGVVHLPMHGVTYTAVRKGGAFRNGTRIRTSRKLRLDQARIAGPKAALDAIEHGSGVILERAPRIASLAWRLVQAAEGALDLGLASPGAHDWDIAAADIILKESGADLQDSSGQSLLYNRRSLKRGLLIAGPRPLLTLAQRHLSGSD